MTNPFEHKTPTNVQIARMAEFRPEFDALHERLLKLPPSRYQSLALTSLEQAALWVNRAVTT